MKSLRTTTVMILLSLTALAQINAQTAPSSMRARDVEDQQPTRTKSRTTGEIYFIGAFPLGSLHNFTNLNNCALTPQPYGVANNAKEGGASYSLGFGIRIGGTLGGARNLSLFGSFDYIFTHCTDLYSDLFASNFQYTNNLYTTRLNGPSYFSMPIMLGVHYDVPISSGFGIFVEGGLGVSLNTLNDMKITSQDMGGYIEYHTLKANTQAGFTFQVGAGFNLGHCLRFGVHYMDMGNYHPTYNVTHDYCNSTFNGIVIDKWWGGTVRMRLLTLRLGFRF